MRRILIMTAILAAAYAPALAAQAPAGAAAGFQEEFSMQFQSSMDRLIALAEAMPAESYDWSPGEGVMSVARVYAHIAHYNYRYPSDRLDATLPAGVTLDGMEEIAKKEEVVELLRASRGFVLEALEEMPPSRLDEPAVLYGREVGGWAVLFQLLAHMNEHLGQSIAYARMNGVVPPWSQ